MRTVIAVWCDAVAGPGWANTPMYYLVKTNDARRLEYAVYCLQPDEQPHSVSPAFWSISNIVHSTLVNAVQQLVDKEDKR